MIQYLNRDNLYEISKYLSNIDNYHLYHSIYSNRSDIYKHLIIMRIQLVYRLYRKIKILKKIYLTETYNFFNKPFYKSNNCIFYMPVIPNGRCRCCNRYKSNHIIKDKTLNLMYKIWYK